MISHHGYATGWVCETLRCTDCQRYIIFLGSRDVASRMVEPETSARAPIPISVPRQIAQDYLEACNVLHLSSKASAALSRRCLQNILNDRGYVARDLAKQIDALLNENDARRALPLSLYATVDAIRNFGNFSAHPIDEKTTLQIVDVEPEEAEWCLEILEEMFEHFYERPAVAAAKKAALDAKLAAAGKPLAK